jgi:hypothetical protein
MVGSGPWRAKYVLEATCIGTQFWQTPLFAPSPSSESCPSPLSSHNKTHMYIVIRLATALLIVAAMDYNYHSSSRRQLKARVKGPTDGPPPLSPIDKIIQLHYGSSTAIEATPERLQASKQYPIPSLPERIEQLQRQNSNLNHEVAYYRQMEPYRMEFQDVVTQVLEKLEKALCKLGKIQQQVNHEWTQVRQGSRAEVQKDN